MSETGQTSETKRVRGWAVAMLAVATIELALAIWAALVALARGGAFCPASGALSCEAIFRPKLAVFIGIPIGRVAMLGAVASLASAAMMMRSKPNAGFARVVALFASIGAAFAIGIQPLAWIAAGPCPICVGLVAMSIAFAALACVVAKKLEKDVILPIVLAVAVGAFVGAKAVVEGRERRAADEIALADIPRVWLSWFHQAPKHRELGNIDFDEPTRKTLVLVERAGCPYCRLMKLDILGDPRLNEVRRELGVDFCVSEIEPNGKISVTAVPTLLLVARGGRELGRVEGYFTDLAPYLELLEKAKR